MTKQTKAPDSLYEAIIKGFSDTEDVKGRRSLFTFVVDHSEPMTEALEATRKSKIDSVISSLDVMKNEMDKTDRGEHLDLGFVGYPLKNGGTSANSMWSDQKSFIQPVNSKARIVKHSAINNGNESLYFAFDKAMSNSLEWKKSNPNPIFNPVIINVTTSKSKYKLSADKIKSIVDNDIYLFNCILDDNCSNNVVIPRGSDIENDFHHNLFEMSSKIPPLIIDLIDFCKGHVSKRFLNTVGNMAGNYGIDPDLARKGANILGNILGGDIRIPTGSGNSYGLNAEIKGLTLESKKGFAFVKGMIGFRLFVKLFN